MLPQRSGIFLPNRDSAEAAMTGSESQSPKPAMPLWLLVATLFGGAFLLQRGQYPNDEKIAAPPAVVPARTSAEGSTSEDRMLAPLREFLGIPSHLSTEADPASLGKLQLDNPLPSGSPVRAQS